MGPGSGLRARYPSKRGRASVRFEVSRRVKILADEHAGRTGVVARVPAGSFAHRRSIRLDGLPGQANQEVDVGVADLRAEEYA